MAQPTFDFSTLNMAKLKQLKVHKCPPTYHYQRDPGNGCYGDAPGFPTYFTRSIYTQSGNGTPYREGSADQVLVVDGVAYITGWHGQTSEQRDKLMKRLYKPLPIEHPRVQAWIRDRYIQSNHCYIHPTEKGDFGRGRKMVIFPVPGYELKTFHDDKRFSDEWRTAEKAAIALANQEIVAAATLVCIPENHSAVLSIREIYPDYQPDLKLMAKPGERLGDWWERYTERPAAADCPGIHNTKHGTYDHCQMCGRTGLKGEAAS